MATKITIFLFQRPAKTLPILVRSFHPVFFLCNTDRRKVCLEGTPGVGLWVGRYNGKHVPVDDLLMVFQESIPRAILMAQHLAGKAVIYAEGNIFCKGAFCFRVCQTLMSQRRKNNKKGIAFFYCKRLYSVLLEQDAAGYRINWYRYILHGYILYNLLQK